MDNINDGVPTFPSHGSMGEVACEGMSLRDYFAIRALLAYMSIERGLYTAHDILAASSYRLADAMLAERVKGGAI